MKRDKVVPPRVNKYLKSKPKYKSECSLLSRFSEEISEKAQKTLIMPIRIRLHRLEHIEIKKKSMESVFEICVIRERKLVFQSSLEEGKDEKAGQGKRIWIAELAE